MELTSESSYPDLYFFEVLGESKSIDFNIYHLFERRSIYNTPREFAHKPSLCSVHNQVHIRQKCPVRIFNVSRGAIC